MKDEGNFYFKQKDYKKAISKYCRVQLFVKPLAPPKSEGPGDDPTLSMVQGMKQFSVSDEEVKQLHELQATAFLNMSICQFLLKEYQKSVDNAKKSLAYNKTIKGYYRLGMAYKQLQNYEEAKTALMSAIKLDVSDPNDIQTELAKVEGLEKAKEKKRLEKMSGFLKNGL